MMKTGINRFLASFGYEVRRSGVGDEVIRKDATFQKLCQMCRPYTMTDELSLYSVFKSVQYILKKNIEGDFVECGVWRGGSSMMIALSLMEFSASDRKLKLYDTFEGMSEPEGVDKLVGDESYDVQSRWRKDTQEAEHNEWCFASLEDVKANLSRTNYPVKNITFIKGKVEDTIPDALPEKISLLRLDTDWFASTKHELEHLYPLLQYQGVLIIDDYGAWAGAKQAVDEYFEDGEILLNRINSSVRLAIKT